jgi:hypothetical protein
MTPVFCCDPLNSRQPGEADRFEAATQPLCVRFARVNPDALAGDNGPATGL